MSAYRLIISATVVGIIVITVLVIGFLLTKPDAAAPPAPAVTTHVAGPPAIPAKPEISFTFIKSKTAGGNIFMVSWNNLPDGTTQLNIYRAQSKSSPWTFWKSINVTPAQLASGDFSFAIGSQNFSGYQFYAEAIGNGITGEGPNSNQITSSVFWTSSSTIPITTTTIPTAPNTSGNTNSQNSATTTPNSGGNPTNTTSTANATTSSSGNTGNTSNNNGGGGNGNTPSGIPYYTPAIQLSGYGNPPTGNFWVQSVNGAIELGWQGLTSDVTSIVISRSTSQTGPWSNLLIQANPAPSSTYTLQVVDGNANTANYYQMAAINGSTTLVVYGPVYLAP